MTKNIGPYSQTKLQKRLLAIFMLVVFLFTALIFRLVVLQVFKSENLQSKAEEQWTRNLPIGAIRGTIYDRNGKVLAISYTAYNVYVRPNSVVDANKVANCLAGILDVDKNVVLKKAQNNNVSEWLIKMSVEEEKAKKLRALNLEGIYISETTKRYYPYGDLLTQVLGYCSVDNAGQSGIELYYNKYLKGVDGYSSVESNITGKELENSITRFFDSVDGCALTLTIDVEIEQFVENALKELVKTENPDSATMIVMDPNTSEIIAMGQKPSFDLNEVPRNDITYLNSATKNLSIVDVYEPGSTFKVLTTCMALEEGLTNVNERFYDPGYRIIDGEKIKCWRLTGHGSQTMTQGLCNSCNSVFVDLALRLGTDKFYDYLEKFGFGNITNVDFAGESAGILMDEDLVKKVDLARMGFGQAVAVTPLQQINAICSVLNGGYLNEPYFVSKISNSYNNNILTFEPTRVRQVISKSTSDTIKVMMEQVIKQYTGINSFIDGYRVSGKTGTTQKYADGKISGEYIASFVGAFPANDPKYVILVAVDNPKGNSYYGSVVATPYAKMVFEDIIEYKNFERTEELRANTNSILMPNLEGMSIAKATALLSGLNLQFEIEGEGAVVKTQYPLENTLIYSRYMCVLKT